MKMNLERLQSINNIFFQSQDVKDKSVTPAIMSILCDHSSVTSVLGQNARIEN